MLSARPPLARPPPPPAQTQAQPQDAWLSDLSAASAVTSLAARTGAASPAAGQIAGDIGNLTGIVSGIERGGVGGDLSAAANAAQLASKIGAGTELGGYAAEAVPPLVIASSIYNFAENYQSGKTGSDALAGAEAGAAIGSVIPGIGTVIGAVIGGAVGALSSAFGGGATDPETKNWQSFIDATGGANATPAQIAKYQNMAPQSAFNLLAGVMDIRDNRIPIVNAFGRMGESDVMNGMFNQINTAVTSGKISSTATPQQMFSQVVTPWLNAKGATITPETGGLQLQAVLTSLIHNWQQGNLTNQTQLTATGSKDANIPTYAGIAARQSPTGQAAAAATTEMLNFGSSKPGGITLASAIPGLSIIAGSTGGGAPGASKMADPTTGTQTTQATGTQGLPTGNPFSDLPAPTSTLQEVPVQQLPGGAASPPAATASDTTGGTSTGGDISSLLSSLSSGVGSFLGSPLGSLTEFGTLAALGLSEANAQKATNDKLAGGLTATGAPFTAAGTAELSQLEGGPQVGGPRGASIADQTTAAANLGKIATTYSTGNLTDAQKQQVSDYVSQQKASAIQELSNRGITDPNSDEYKTAMQQIDNNAAELGQSLITQDTQLAQGALAAVQSTYSNLINQALSESEFGFSTELAGVQTQIQSDTQLSTSLNSLFAGIAQGVGTAFKGSAGGPGTGATPSVPSGVASTAAGGATGSGVASSPAGGGATPGQLRTSGGGESGIAAGGPSAADQATYDANQAGFAGPNPSAADTAAQQTIDQYGSSYTPPDISVPGADIPAYTTDPFTGGDPFGGFGG